MPHLEAALKFYQPAGYRTQTSNALILLGRVYRDKGEYAVAMKHFPSNWNWRSSQATRRDRRRLTPASASFWETTRSCTPRPSHISRKLSDQQVDRRRATPWDGSGQSRGVAVGVREIDEAKAALNEAYAIAAGPEAAGSSPNSHTWYDWRVDGLSLGHRVEATTRATAALNLAERDYKDTALQAKQTLALAEAISGAPKKAVALVQEAVDAARESNFPGSCRQHCSPRPSSHCRRRRAGRARRRAGGTEGVRSAAQLESEWRAWLVSVRSMRLEGDSATAYDYAVRAETSRAALQARWGEDTYRGTCGGPTFNSV